MPYGHRECASAGLLVERRLPREGKGSGSGEPGTVKVQHGVADLLSAAELRPLTALAGGG